MGLNLTQKILGKHRASGQVETAQPIGLRVDQAVLRGSTGALACLLFEAKGVLRQRAGAALACADLSAFDVRGEDVEIRRFLQSFSARFGLHFAKPGSGACHQVVLERFAEPGALVVSTDAEGIVAGAVGAIGLTADPIDMAEVLAGEGLETSVPKVVGVRLQGSLPPWISGFDVGLELLRRLTVKGGLGRVLEYYGDGLKSLSVWDRALIAGLNAELGAAGAVFPSDERTREFLSACGRKDAWSPLAADKEAVYEEYLDLDLGLLEPMVAKPHSADNVCSIRELEGSRVNQVAIHASPVLGAEQIGLAAAAIKSKGVHPGVSCLVSPGSRRTHLESLAAGFESDLLAAGGRWLEAGSALAAGAAFLPGPHGVSVRTSHVNGKGCAGSTDAMVYLASPAVAAATAVRGAFADPRAFGKPPHVQVPRRAADDADPTLVAPPRDGGTVEVQRGAFIRPWPACEPVAGDLQGVVLLKPGDHVTTDQILPAEARGGLLRLNLPALSHRAFEGADATFARRAMEAGSGILVAGESYGKGPGGWLAAAALRYLGVAAVLAKSFAPEHLSDLVAFGIVPLTFAEAKGYASVLAGDVLRAGDFRRAIAAGKPFSVHLPDRKLKLQVLLPVLSKAQVERLLSGGILGRTGSRTAAKPAKARKAGGKRKR